VTGITKPNADIEVIMSPLLLITDNLTKKRLNCILCWNQRCQQKQIKKGSRYLKGFAQRTNNTNVILFGVPYRYDLPPSSRINTEVKLFNKRLKSVTSTFNYVRGP
jgi:hypothetical protein